MRYTVNHHTIQKPAARVPSVLIWLRETQGLAEEMGSSSSQELSTPSGTLACSCLRTVVPGAVAIYKDGKVLPRQPSTTMAITRNVPRQDQLNVLWEQGLPNQTHRIGYLIKLSYRSLRRAATLQNSFIKSYCQRLMKNSRYKMHIKQKTMRLT